MGQFGADGALGARTGGIAAPLVSTTTDDEFERRYLEAAPFGDRQLRRRAPRAPGRARSSLAGIDPARPDADGADLRSPPRRRARPRSAYGADLARGQGAALA